MHSTCFINVKTGTRDKKWTRIQCFRMILLRETLHHGSYNKQRNCHWLFVLFVLYLYRNKTIVKMILSTKSALEAWWQTYRTEFVNTPMQGLPLVQREYADPAYNANAKLSTLKMCPIDVIPYIEITPLYRKLDPNIPGILFVNCNPSGTDYKHYRDFYQRNVNTCTDFFLYDKEDNSYFNEAKKFAKTAGVSLNESNLEGNYAMIDIFPIVIQNQAVLKEAYYNATDKRRRDAFNGLLRIFVRNVYNIKPKVIVATNAFVKNLLTSDDDYSLGKLGLLKATYEGDEFVRYRLKINDFTTTLFCGGMIAGGHRMDTESRKRLERDVKHFFSGTAIPIA